MKLIFPRMRANNTLDKPASGLNPHITIAISRLCECAHFSLHILVLHVAQLPVLVILGFWHQKCDAARATPTFAVEIFHVPTQVTKKPANFYFGMWALTPILGVLKAFIKRGHAQKIFLKPNLIPMISTNGCQL